MKMQVFRGANVKLRNWRQVTVSRITSTKGRNNVPNHQREDVLKSKVDDTHGNVYSHRLSYLVYKVRKGGDFFYGKSSNENHIESL